MKVLIAAIALFTSTTAGAWEVRKIEQNDRKLEAGFGFLISNAEDFLCITATDNTNFGTLKLAPCDFTTAPPEQLWKLQDGKFVNGNGKCMVVNHGQDLFDGVRMRLADCDSLSFKEFTYDGEYIKVASDHSYCLTSRGTTAQAGDTIHAKPCRDRADFKWSLQDADDGTLYSFYADGGCIQPKNGSTAKFTEIILDECDVSRAWNVKQVNGIVTFRSRLDISMCLQTGWGGYVEHGTKLRLMPCEENEEYQEFDWSDETPIKLASRDDLCLEWRGLNVNVGVDPVIMKTCDRTVYDGWSGDAVE